MTAHTWGGEGELTVQELGDVEVHRFSRQCPAAHGPGSSNGGRMLVCILGHRDMRSGEPVLRLHRHSRRSRAILPGRRTLLPQTTSSTTLRRRSGLTIRDISLTGMYVTFIMMADVLVLEAAGGEDANGTEIGRDIGDHDAVLPHIPLDLVAVPKQTL